MRHYTYGRTCTQQGGDSTKQTFSYAAVWVNPPLICGPWVPQLVQTDLDTAQEYLQDGTAGSGHACSPAQVESPSTPAVLLQIKSGMQLARPCLTQPCRLAKSCSTNQTSVDTPAATTSRIRGVRFSDGLNLLAPCQHYLVLGLMSCCSSHAVVVVQPESVPLVDMLECGSRAALACADIGTGPCASLDVHTQPTLTGVVGGMSNNIGSISN